MEKEMVEIFDISYEGSGVGRIDGQVVFVPKTLKNEKVEIQVLKKNNKFMLGRLLSVEKPNSERVSAPCSYYDICGGCDFQHCTYKLEEEYKREILLEEMKKVGFVGTDQNFSFVGSLNRFKYRNKIKLEVVENSLGFFKAKSHDFFAVKKCLIASDRINEALPKIEQFLFANCFNLLKSVYVKEVDENILLCFLFDDEALKTPKDIKEIEILNEFSVIFAYGDVLESNKTKTRCVLGAEKINRQYGDFFAWVDISSFNQINDEVAKKMYDYVLDKTVDKRVVNAYSGQGVLTYLISQKAKFVYGIEHQISAHEMAEKLKAQSLEYKFENICGKVEDCLETILIKDRIDSIVLDPAREGCAENVLNVIIGSKISEIVYISCNFATLVRDLKRLGALYNIDSVKVFDMFPCTANMETVVVLKRNPK